VTTRTTISRPEIHSARRWACARLCPMASELSPLVLLHGLSMSASAWRETIPLVAVHHEVFTPNALGHRGGPPVQRRPVTIWDVIDAAERYLDERGLKRPHLAGNSMGGFVALELARRGRAESVSAFSPAGLWSDALRARAMKRVRRAAAMTRITHGITPLVMKSPLLRRWAMRDLAWHGDRISAARAVEVANDALGCSIIDEVCREGDEQMVAMDPLPCPITIAWAEKDTLLPVEVYKTAVTERLAGAVFTILPGVGHVPMLDDPELVARTILAVTGAAKD
jgi:pimeloyl-ACP methyl ester carboxylesterase